MKLKNTLLFRICALYFKCDNSEDLVIGMSISKSKYALIVKLRFDLLEGQVSQ